MTPHKPLFAAMAAAGIVAAVIVPVAQSETSVFVPELALLDGAACRMPQARSPVMIRLAQAATAPTKKTELSPAAPAAAAAAPAVANESDPPLMTGLGKLHLRVSTSSPAAQRYFDQGLRLAWGFNHDEARRAFRKAQRLDPDCAMCYWGEAWVLGPNINAPMDEQAVAPAVAAAEKARSRSHRATPREQALIEAIAERYSPDPAAKRAELNTSYARAMREAVQRFPADNEIAVLYADALMNLAPWDYWEAGGTQAKLAVAELVPTLERVLKKQPDHAGAIHLYIHAVEASDNPRRAERYADALGKLAPGAGHLVHMPSHIYYRIGRYRDSLAANRAAVKVDEAYIAREKAVGIYPLGYYPHNVHFVMVSAEMGGDGAAVVESANKLARIIPDEAARAFPMVQPMKAAPYFAHARFSQPATVMALAAPGEGVPYVQAVWRYARGLVLARQGKTQDARAELAQIDRLIASTDYTRYTEANIPAREVMQIASHMLRARIAQTENDLNGAVASVEAAAVLYDTLPYMEPPYWPYPVKQTLGALLVLRGDYERARGVFGEALARMPNNAWALYGLREAYARDGRSREARAVDKRLSGLWMGERGHLDLATL
ncbi:MAG: tetratricopeptide repeat protein [Rhodospirillaceae bacterium]